MFEEDKNFYRCDTCQDVYSNVQYILSFIENNQIFEGGSLKSNAFKKGDKIKILTRKRLSNYIFPANMVKRYIFKMVLFTQGY